MYDVYDDGAAKNNLTHTWNIGWIRYLDQSTKLKFFCKKPDNKKSTTAIVEVVVAY